MDYTPPRDLAELFREPLGRWKDGRPFYLIGGGSQDAGAAGGNGGTSGGAQEGAGSAGAGQGEGGDGGSGSAGAGAGDGAGTGDNAGGAGGAAPSDGGAAGSTDGAGTDYSKWTPAQLTDALIKARAESTKARTEGKKAAAKEAEDALAQRIGKAIGLIKDDGAQLDPKQLQESLEAERGKGRQAVVDLAIYQRAHANGANADKLLDSRTFAQKVGSLDPDGAEFASQLDAVIKEAVASDATFRLGSIPGAGGADLSGGSGGSGGGSNSTDVDTMRARLHPPRK